MSDEAVPKDFALLHHELRTPLNAILGFSQMLLWDDQFPLPPKQREMVEHIQKGGEDLLTMLDAWAESQRST